MEEIIISSILLFAGILINMFTEDIFTKIFSASIVISQIIVLLVFLVIYIF